jgi:tetratricopeptide (TPR) repeat protein
MKHFFLSALFVAISLIANAQSPLKLPPLSPNAKFSQDFSTSSIEVSYSRPSMRGRKVFGDVVAYDHAWRTGANAPTKIKIGEELEIAGQKVKAGEYTLYTIPGKNVWEIVLSNGTGNFGPDGYSRDFDVARFFIKPVYLDLQGEVQTFTIQITDITFTTCKIELTWERTRISIPVIARSAERINESIDKAINHPAPPPYFQVASYYFESDMNLSLANDYVNKALETDPKAFYMWYLKARIERKMGHEEEAIAAARKSMEMAKGTANEREYMHNNQKLIDEINRHKPKRQVND